ncbi:MAG: PD-(D/E)XK nuclease family transposase [Spirochaetales bacterium]|nr:PD-(D/E)XK nuclease family transposase [Spirochaetales bacterium]
MSYYLNPVRDIFIKYLFGREENSDLLLSFINAVLEDTDFPLIKEVKLKNPFNYRTFIMDKETILDVKATDLQGNHYDIEVQAGKLDDFTNRILFYWAKQYANQLEKGQDYALLKPVICINLVDGTLFPGIEKLHTCYVISEKDNPGFVLSDHLIIHFLEMEKASGKMKENLDHWIRYFTYEGKEEEAMEVLLHNYPVFTKAHEQYEQFTRNDELRELYEAREKWQRDQISRIKTAERMGKEMGMKIGEEIGEKATGKRIAINMLKEGFSVDQIVKVTQLTKEEVEDFRNEIKKI